MQFSTVDAIFWNQLRVIACYFGFMLIPLLLLLVVGWLLSKSSFSCWLWREFLLLYLYSIQSLFHIIFLYLLVYIGIHTSSTKKGEDLRYFCWILTWVYSTKLNLHSSLALWPVCCCCNCTGTCIWSLFLVLHKLAMCCYLVIYLYIMTVSDCNYSNIGWCNFTK